MKYPLLLKGYPFNAYVPAPIAAVTPFRGTFDKNRGEVAAVQLLATPQGAQAPALFNIDVSVGGVNVVESQTGNTTLPNALHFNNRRAFVGVGGGQSFGGLIDGTNAVVPCPFWLLAWYSNPFAQNVNKIYDNGLGLRFKDYQVTEAARGATSYDYIVPKNQGRVIAIQLLTDTSGIGGANWCEVSLSVNGATILQDVPAVVGYYLQGYNGTLFGVDIDPASTLKFSVDNDRNTANAVSTGFRLYFDTDLETL